MSDVLERTLAALRRHQVDVEATIIRLQQILEARALRAAADSTPQPTTDEHDERAVRS